MRRKLLSLGLLLVIVIYVLPQSVMACACCADEGTWIEYNGDMEEYQSGILRELKIAPRAELTGSEAETDEEAGESLDVAGYNFFISLLPQEKQWELTFRNPKGKTGKLTLMIPTTYIAYKVDLRAKSTRKAATREPVLYKEWRLSGDVKGTGIFERGLAAGGTFKLILQGRGNNCDNASDFQHWVLQVKGTKTEFAFYGSLK